MMYGRRFFSRILAMTEQSEIDLNEVLIFMSLFGFGMGITFANLHVCGMMLMFNVMSDILVISCSF